MTNYTWNVSAGGMITGGTGTNQITVNWTAAGAQTVSVNYTNHCMNQAVTPTFLNVTVEDFPAAAGTIIGPGTVAAGATGVPYTVAPVAGAATYIWNLIPGATFASGQWTNNITVNFPSYVSSGFMTVLGNNMCGNGPASPGFYVNVIIGIEEEDINSPVSIYPNPGDGLFTLRLYSIKQEVFTVQIFNNLGSMISELNDIGVKGTVQKVIDLRSEANGVYSVLIRNNNTWIVKKVLLNK
jgi:hypothetical protein